MLSQPIDTTVLYYLTYDMQSLVYIDKLPVILLSCSFLFRGVYLKCHQERESLLVSIYVYVI